MSNRFEIVQAYPVTGEPTREREAGGVSKLVYPADRRGQQRPGPRVVARRKNSLIFLDPEGIWAFQAADRLTFVHAPEGTFEIDLSLAGLEASFGPMLFRVHRNWLVNLVFVKELERVSGGATLTVGSDLAHEGRNIRAPVSKDRAKALRNVLLKNATGLRNP